MFRHATIILFALSFFAGLSIGTGCRTTTAVAAPAEPAALPDEAPAPEAEVAVVETTGTLAGLRVAFLVGEGFHDGETFVPMAYLHNRGAKVVVIGVEPGIVTAYNSDITVVVQESVGDVSIDDFDALVIPGGRSPDWLRQHEEIVSFAGDYFRADGLTAAICHGPQVLVAAGVLDGRRSTCFPDMKEELDEAGAAYEDVPMLKDGNLITSRNPDDIPAFCRAIEQALLE